MLRFILLTGLYLLGPLLGAYVVNAAGVRSRITIASGFATLRGALVMALVFGAIGSAGLVYAHMVPGSGFWAAWLKWGMSDLLGIICIAPSMLRLTTGPSEQYFSNAVVRLAGR